MNNIRNIEKITAEELRLGIYGGLSKGSWHDEYKDSAWVYLGGFAYELTEGDLICVMSQWGEVEDIHLVREKETGKSKGFAFVKYEDQRSTILAVDNFNGTKMLGRTLRCDHVSQYKLPKDVRDREGEAFQADPSSRIEIGPGHAYKGKELANEYDINDGVDLWNKRVRPASSSTKPATADTESEEDRRPAPTTSRNSRKYSTDSEDDVRGDRREKSRSDGRRSSRRKDSRSRSRSPVVGRHHHRDDDDDNRNYRHNDSCKDRDRREKRDRSRTPPRKRRHDSDDEEDDNDRDNRRKGRSRDRHDRPQSLSSSSNRHRDESSRRSSGGEKVLEELAVAVLTSRNQTAASTSSSRPLSLQPTLGAPVASWRGRRDPALRKAVEDVKRVIERIQGSNSDIPEKRRDELSGIGGVHRIR